VRFAAKSKSIEYTDGSSGVILAEAVEGQNVIVMYPDLYEKCDEEFEPCGRLLRELKEDERGTTRAQLSTLTAILIHETTHCILSSRSIHDRNLQLVLTNWCDSR
jgi:hypothetical protein